MLPILTDPATCPLRLARFMGGAARAGLTILAAPWFAPGSSNPRQPARIWSAKPRRAWRTAQPI